MRQRRKTCLKIGEQFTREILESEKTLKFNNLFKYKITVEAKAAMFKE